MPSIFTQIIKGDIPAFKVAENEHFLAFLDAFPLVEGHVLVIPKREEDYIFDLADQELADLMTFAKKVAHGMRQVLPCTKIGISVVGLEVPHAHVHLIPLNRVSDMDFSKPKLKVDAERMEAIRSQIAEAIIH